MASHGHRSRLGMALASETLAVLMHSGLPVLVAATGEPKPPAHAIGIIRDEHRSLAAVLHAWMHVLEGARGGAVDTEPMHAILRYIRDFPVALHHPKEEQYLFRKLRERTSAVDAELDELERQHERDHHLVEQLSRLLDGVERATDVGARQRATRELADAVAQYAKFIWEHLGREEAVILPAAQRHLNAADWVDIDAAFSANRDPRFGDDADHEYRRLFSRIVNLAEAN
jgi:hemerythrin-like domain-containing protein